MAERNPAPPIRCGCGATWTGLAAAHCACCHRTFSALGLFDKHRTTEGTRGACLDPARLRNSASGEPVMFYRDGMWRGPEMTEADRARRAG